MQMYMRISYKSEYTADFFSGRDPFHGVPFIVSLVVLHFAFNNNTKVALCTIAKKTRVTTVKDTQTDLNILVMRLAERAGYQCSTVTQSCLVLLWRKENCCPYASNNTCHSAWLKKGSNYKRKPLRLRVYSANKGCRNPPKYDIGVRVVPKT